MPLIYITNTKISKFIFNCIICRFSIPYYHVTYNGTSFKNENVKELSK